LALSTVASDRFVAGTTYRWTSSPAAADFRAPYERKARTGCRSRGVSRKSKSRKRHHSPYSRGPHELKARAGFRSRDVLKESHPTFPWMRHGQKARVGSELGTKSMGNRSTVRAFCTEARATAIASPHAFEARAGPPWKPSPRAETILTFVENTYEIPIVLIKHDTSSDCQTGQLHLLCRLPT